MALVWYSASPMSFVHRIAAKALVTTGLCERIVIERDGYRLRFHPSAFSAGLWVNPSWGARDEQFVKSRLGPGKMMLDIGANIGTLSLAAATTGARVVAVEAHPRTFKFLSDNIRLNKYDRQIVPIHTAVGDASGSIPFSDLADDDQNHVVQSGIKVPMQTIDSLAEVVGREAFEVALLKIDVEGYELQALQGATETLKKTECVYFESFDEHCRYFGYEARAVFELLMTAGFTVTDLDGKPIDRRASSPRCRNLIALRSN